MSGTYPNSRSGAAMLLGVMILVASATLAATGLVISGTSRDLSQRTESRVLDSRAMVRELIAAVQVELDEQFEDIIAGRTPELDSATVLISQQGQRRWIARVAQAPGDSPFLSEAGKLNLNTVPESVLLALDSMPQATVEAILRTRPFSSVRQAISAAGESIDTPWASQVTVFSSDPSRSVGLSLAAGADRVRLSAEGDQAPELARFIEESGFDPFPEEGQSPESLTELYSLCVSSNLPITPTGKALDLLTFQSGPRVGLLDLNNASRSCLASLPGLNAEIAEELVDTRGRLSLAELSALNWPVREMILTPEQLAGVIGLITTRTLQWGVTIESGLAMNDEEDASTVALEYPLRYTLVIDVSNPVSRVIMIRDKTNASGAVPPPLRPVAEDPALNLLSERASSFRTARTARQASRRPSVTSPPSANTAAPIRRDRSGLAGAGGGS